MTNAQYVMTLLTDRDLAELFTSSKWSTFYTQPNNKKVAKAFQAWQRDTYRPNRNYTKEGEPNPSVWEWEMTHNHKNNQWELTGRTTSLAFQHWLFLQYNEKHWN